MKHPTLGHCKQRGGATRDSLQCKTITNLILLTWDPTYRNRTLMQNIQCKLRTVVKPNISRARFLPQKSDNYTAITLKLLLATGQPWQKQRCQCWAQSLCTSCISRIDWHRCLQKWWFVRAANSNANTQWWTKGTDWPTDRHDRTDMMTDTTGPSVSRSNWSKSVKIGQSVMTDFKIILFLIKYIYLCYLFKY